ncbi:PucR family transcriptional regulator [Sciscionella sediminilitoris]|uniref:PucR family transcriptional regulator n=1 Tax=Sciscionella sediminilitoris TaxID=1445613 RepID=UPI0004DF1935|nr:helix-turn-helix domain-containing protein [Sciscionella sp. SE31]
MLTDWTLRYIDWVSSEAERAYLAERDALLDSRLATTRLLLSRLVEDDFPDYEQRDSAVRPLGLDPETPHVAVIVGAASRSSTTFDGPLGEILRVPHRLLPKAVSALLRRGAVVLVPTAAAGPVAELVTRALEQVAEIPGDINAGVGRPAMTAAGIAAAVREAERARALGEILHPKAWIHDYESIGFFDLFRQGEAVETFVEAVLGELLGRDRRGKIDLVRTLYVYFTLGMNRRAAASRLGIHPNTLDYRLRQAARSSGVSSTSPEVSFRFQLAVRLLPLCTRHAWLDDRSSLADILIDW